MNILGAANVKKLFILLSLLFSLGIPTASFADIAADKGDIVVFNMPLRTEKIKVQLFQCKGQKPVCQEQDWSPLTTASPTIMSGDYYVFRQNQMHSSYALTGTTIGARVYSFVENRWSTPLLLVKGYSQAEDPFYQFFCWARHEAPPHFFCISGEENEEDQVAE